MLAVNNYETCNSHFTQNDIDSCMLLLKSGKNDGNSGYTSDHIICGTKLLRSHLLKLFNLMINHCFAPDNFRLSTLVPIPKNKRKSINASNNYRAIALSSVFGKLLDNVILIKYDDVLNTSNMQYGFKKKHRTTQ